MAAVQRSHLDWLESEAIYILREVAGQCQNPVLFFSGGKDSLVLLRLAEKAFRPARFPFPLLHIDTGHNFPEVIAFRDRRAAELGERLIVRTVEDSIRRGTVRLRRGASSSSPTPRATSSTRATWRPARAPPTPRSCWPTPPRGCWCRPGATCSSRACSGCATPRYSSTRWISRTTRAGLSRACATRSRRSLRRSVSRARPSFPARRCRATWWSRAASASAGTPGRRCWNTSRRIATGFLRAGAEVQVLPGGRRARVREISLHGQARELALAGDSVALVLDEDLDIARGDLIADAARPPRAAAALEAKLLWLDAEPLRPEGRYLLQHATRLVPARVEQVLGRLDVHTLAALPFEGNVGANDVVRARLALQVPVFVDPYEASRATGAFILIDAATHRTVAAGLIE